MLVGESDLLIRKADERSEYSAKTEQHGEHADDAEDVADDCQYGTRGDRPALVHGRWGLASDAR